MKADESVHRLVAAVTLGAVIALLALLAAGVTGAVIAVAGFWCGIVVSEFVVGTPTSADAGPMDHT